MPKHRGGGAGGSSQAARPARKNGRAVKTAGPKTDRPDRPDTDDNQQRAIPFAEQQRLLDAFARALEPTLASPQLPTALQAVKRALFERDFASAFAGADDSTDDIPPLDAYAARWSPTRALCYAAILRSPLVQAHWRPEQTVETAETVDPARSTDAALRMVAIGGGAAETVAFGAALADHGRGDLVLVDSGPWASVVGKLCGSLTTTTTPTPALIHPPDRLAVDVRQLDILQVDDAAMADLLQPAAATDRSRPTLVTLFFTLNELFTAGGIGATATCLLRLTAAAAPGTLLLVVDSPGSYAETTVGAQARRYPMRWLLDKILLQDAAGWTKLHQDDAVWFRLPPGLVYPIRLEDMRYQVHLYVRSTKVNR